MPHSKIPHKSESLEDFAEQALKGKHERGSEAIKFAMENLGLTLSDLKEQPLDSFGHDEEK